MIGGTVVNIYDVPCGNMVSIVGIDQFLIKTATIGSIDIPLEETYPIKPIKCSVLPIVRVSVKPKNPVDLPKFIDGLKKLAKSDPLLICDSDETGEYMVTGSGEFHVESCLKNLEKDYAQCDIIRS
jgi:elongation factor 2